MSSEWINGVDFSGSAKPGCDIWLTSGEWDGEFLTVTDVRPASAEFRRTKRDTIIDGLRAFVCEGGATGLDFSFGLPKAILPDNVDSWRASVEWVREEWADVTALDAQTDWKDRARDSAVNGVELKRTTDRSAGASSPYSFITRYQTFHGMRDFLGPLLADDSVTVEPMESGERPTVIEIYPAGTLRALDLPDKRYKDDVKYSGGPERREEILEGLVAWGVDLPDGTRERLLGDDEGDALDSLVAAVATARAVESGFAVEDDRYDSLEGYIYV